MSAKNAEKKIHEAMMNCEGVTAAPHRFGGTEYKLGKREIGHIHGNYLADIPFPKKVRNEIIEKKEALPHHILPDSGWISVYINNDEDVDKAIKLLLRSYHLAAEQMKIRNQII
jgi:hypothetical protein